MMEPRQYLDGKTDRRGRSCYRRGALESWKAEGFEDGFGRELDAWQWNDWRAGMHGSIEWSGGEWNLDNIWMSTWRDGKGVIEVEVLVELISWFGS